MIVDQKNITTHILALSWNIATEPKLYRELASNPYSLGTLKIISERFPATNVVDVIRAIVLAEPEGKYDRNFKELTKTQQETELFKEQYRTTETNKHLIQYYNNHAAGFDLMPKRVVYDNLSRYIFNTTDLKKIEEKYSQNQRKDFRLLIVNYIENTQKPKTIWSSYEKPATGPLLKIFFAIFSFIILFYSANGFYETQINQAQTKSGIHNLEGNRQILGITTQKDGKLPLRLKIPAINVDTSIQYVGVTPKGEMDVPKNTLDVGWFELGPPPGENGSAVIAGHVDGENGKIGVFANLHKLKKGDKLYVEDRLGKSRVFVVKESRSYTPGYADDVFSRNDGTHLNLITCEGVWNKAKKSYSKRLVVFADMSN